MEKKDSIDALCEKPEPDKKKVLDSKKAIQETFDQTPDTKDVWARSEFLKSFTLKRLEEAKLKYEKEALYDWLCDLLGKERAEDFILENISDNNFLILVSNDGLERNQRWDILQQKGADDILYKHGLYDKMSTYGLYEYQLYEQYFHSNWKIQPDDENAMEYLAQIKRWDILFKNFEKYQNNECFLNFYAKHQKFNIIELVTPYFLTTIPEGVAYLQQRKKYSLLAQVGLYECVNWNEYLKCNQFGPKKEAVEYAEKAELWDVLMQNHQHWVLLKHGHLWKFIKSFF